MRILGIESSCDETAAAVVQDGRQVLSNVIATSLEEHKLYGGVVPEIASRRHAESISGVVRQALAGGRLPPLRERYCNRLTVGADSIRPLNPAGRRRYAGAIEGIKTGRCGHRPLQKYKDCGEYSRIIPQSAALTAPFTREPMRLQNLSPPCKG